MSESTKVTYPKRISVVQETLHRAQEDEKVEVDSLSDQSQNLLNFAASNDIDESDNGKDDVEASAAFDFEGGDFVDGTGKRLKIESHPSIDSGCGVEEPSTTISYNWG
jgi:hypothetical protein